MRGGTWHASGDTVVIRTFYENRLYAFRHPPSVALRELMASYDQYDRSIIRQEYAPIRHGYVRRLFREFARIREHRCQRGDRSASVHSNWMSRDCSIKRQCRKQNAGARLLLRHGMYERRRRVASNLISVLDGGRFQPPKECRHAAVRIRYPGTELLTLTVLPLFFWQSA